MGCHCIKKLIQIARTSEYIIYILNADGAYDMQMSQSWWYVNAVFIIIHYETAAFISGTNIYTSVCAAFVYATTSFAICIYRCTTCIYIIIVSVLVSMTPLHACMCNIVTMYYTIELLLVNIRHDVMRVLGMSRMIESDKKSWVCYTCLNFVISHFWGIIRFYENNRIFVMRIIGTFFIDKMA